MAERWDVIVTGLGAMGSAAVREIARRGLRVLGLDRYETPHARGSTHGRTRIIREAYFEHPAYVPLVRRAEALWDALSEEVGHALLLRTGGLMIGPERGGLVAGARASAEQHGLPYELLTSNEVRAHYPVLAPEPEMVALYEPRAGVLFPEACVRALVACAAGDGAEIRMDEAMLSWRVEGGVVRVATALSEHVAERLVLALGPWLPEHLNGASLPLTVERQMQHWFMPHRNMAHFGPEKLPIALWQMSDAERVFYTLPDFGHGVKAAIHHDGEITDPERVRRIVSEEEDATVRRLVDHFLPDAAGELRERAVCLYTNTPDGHFLIDRHLAYPEVLIVSACSGHGFKFATAIGEVVAKLVTDETPDLDLSLFRNRY
ncbi:MAG: N-methyl-L-tryptophan oxidase [Gemmatimonadaceae bacterium]